MKSLLAMLATLLVLNFSAIDTAEAKRLGGGMSFGKSYSTKPAPRITTPPAGSQQAAAQPTKRSGLMGGLLGGLLAGGLIAALFGGAFEGFAFMDLLIFAGIAFVLFKLFKSRAASRNTASPAGYAEPGSFGNAQSRESSNTGFGGIGSDIGGTGSTSDVPFNLPAGFNLDAFLNEARDHYRALQEAWNKNDLDKLREYFSPEMFQQLSAERAQLASDPHTEVMFVDVELGRADYDQTTAQVSLRFSGRYKDTVEGIEEDITDIWHLERDLSQANSPWVIVGIEG
jgi:predicted lipid-binding transport protein (Tim44 family)